MVKKNGETTIGANVDICASVCIIGDVNIGSNSTIRAGSVVVKNVQENATVAGKPAKVVSYKTLVCFIINRWKKQ